ncbi:hypothetical protein ACHAW6_007341 [Cyclotella cf. meneghiniana]
MLIIEIDSNAILIEPMKSRANKDIIADYDKLVNQLKWAGITHKQHVLDNEMSEHMKNHISYHYRFKMELSARMSQSKCTRASLSTATDFPQANGPYYYHKQKSPSTSCNNHMVHQQYKPTLTSAGPSTTTRCHKCPWDVKHKYMTGLPNMALGPITVWMVVTSLCL